MDRAFDAALEADGVAFDGRDARLLEAIDEAGSLNAAARSLGRSYSRAHGRLEELESAFGPLVERRRGGSEGGGSRLTDGARDLLGRFERLRTDLAGTASVAETVIDGRVLDRDGELGTVRTAAGDLRAVVPPDAGAVEVAVRADAVTLHAPEEAPEGDATSARNRFSGTVAGVEDGEAVAVVAVDVGAADPLRALVTRESLDGLGLGPGDPVVASFKATATRATPAR
jgi:molybdate transport system regulatory protein